ncbi:MAG: hypothetical protein OXG11_03010, partial [Chloroflexi bacterium]|nr:hypothetical protein [Chloroflexota bacterium]
GPVPPKAAAARARQHIDPGPSQPRQTLGAVAKSRARSSGDPVGQYDRSWGRNWFIGTQSDDESDDGAPPKP